MTKTYFNYCIAILFLVFSGCKNGICDSNDAWEGTQHLNFGKGLDAAIVLTGTMDGMPMMYSGQEAGLNRALSFFEKDPIQ